VALGGGIDTAVEKKQAVAAPVGDLADRAWQPSGNLPNPGAFRTSLFAIPVGSSATSKWLPGSSPAARSVEVMSFAGPKIKPRRLTRTCLKGPAS